MTWLDVCDTVDHWTQALRKVACDLQSDCAIAFTRASVGYYANPVTQQLGYYSPLACSSTSKVADDLLQSIGSRHGFTSVGSLAYADLADETGQWVKLAMSPTLHRMGEILNFYPGQLPGGIPNAPSPLAATLTSGVLGAGLGWGAGRLAKKLMPEGYGDNLDQLGLLLGGAAGAAPGLAWGMTNKAVGRSFNDPSLLQTNDPYPETLRPFPQTVLPVVGEHLHNTILPKSLPKIGSDLVDPRFRATLVKIAETFGADPESLPATPSDVNINHLGQVLWDTGASPGLAATTMGAMYAAQQMPDPRSRPGLVTGHQLGQLAANAAGDYIRGRLVGAAINTAIGTPYGSHAFGLGGIALGVLGTVVPKLFTP